MTELAERKRLISEIDEAVAGGARQAAACKAINLLPRTLSRWRLNQRGDKRKITIKNPPNKLTDAEQNEIIQICCSPEYRDMSPNEIVPKMAENGLYIASEASFYRILKKNQLVSQKSQKSGGSKKPKTLVASGPNQVWSWDITYLCSTVKGLYHYLYLVTDIWSRKIMGWEIHDSQSAELAAELMKRLCNEHSVNQLNLHSDNGSPMKGATMLATLQRLGVTPSFSRPGVSNDNAYSESLFKTLKYRPGYPQQFSSIEEAREWTLKFVLWYNTMHMHSGIKYVTPDQRHFGLDKKILETRNKTYLAARQRQPLRWTRSTRNWQWEEKIYLNPENNDLKIDKVA